MLALGESQALEAKATEASKVTYTISGVLVSPGTPPTSSNYEILAQGQVASTTGELYEPGASHYALLSSIHLYNTSTTVEQVVTLYAKGTAGSNELARIVVPIEGFATYEDGKSWQVYTKTGQQQVAAALPLTTASSYIGSNVTCSATTAKTIAELELAVGTWLIFGSALLHLTTAELGHCDSWLGPTTNSKTGAYVSTTVSEGDIAGGVEEMDITLMTVQTFSSTTTVHLEVYPSKELTAEHLSIEESIANATGILAIKIG